MTHQILYPGTVAGWRHGQLDQAGAEQQDEQQRGDVLPHVVVEAEGREAQHVLQVLKEPGSARGSLFVEGNTAHR